MLLLGAGYLAGLLIALKFNKKSPEDLQREFASSDRPSHAIGKTLLDIHKNIFESAQESVFSPENRARIAEYKERFLVELDSFKKDANAKMEEWKQKGFDKKDEMEAELRKLYERRVELLEQAKDKGLKLMEDAKESGMDFAEEGKRLAERTFERAKKRLDDMYADTKAKLNKAK